VGVALALVLALACQPAQKVTAERSNATWPGAFVAAADVGDLAGVTILDAREADAYRAGHLPGARRADWTITREGMVIGGKLKPPAEIAVAFEKLGVHEGRRVLVCGAGRAGWGEEGRIAWTLRALGHPSVAILDGGCASLKARFTQEKPPEVRGAFKPKMKRALRATRADVEAGLKSGAQLLDVRTREEFDGARKYLEARGGHIPGARHLELNALLDAGGRARGRADVERLLRGAGLDPSRPIIAYCTGGVRSALATEILRARGIDARNYDGSFWEWAADDSLPIE
jgi:thiosulfate/3-mercaptopyruvate sulfurtransferase